MAVTKGFIISCSVLIQHDTAGQDKCEVNTVLTGLCDSHFNVLAARTGDSNGWGYCGLFMFFELFRKLGEAVNEDGASTRNAWCAVTLSEPSHALWVHPEQPSEDSESLFDPYAVLSAGRPGDVSSPFSLQFQVTHSFLKDPEVLTLSCNGISYAKIGQTCQLFKYVLLLF